MLFVKFLHVVFIVAAFAIVVGGGAMPRLVARSRDVRAIRVVFRAWMGYSNLIAPLFGLGALLGIATALVFRFDLLQPWLVISYVLVVIALVLGAGLDARWHGRVLTAALASPDEQPSEELEAALRDPIGLFAYWGLVALTAALLFDMVVKPLG